MPELPEVETLRLGLEKYLVGHKIVSVDVKLKKLVTGNTADVTGAKIKAVRRSGKGLLIDLSNGYTLAIHIKLTGQLIYQGPKVSKGGKVPNVSKEKVGTVPNKFTHVIFHLDKGGVLYYNDARQFGWIKIVKTEEVVKLPFFRDLGPEAPVLQGATLAQGRTLTIDRFRKIIGGASTKIKPLLMDQTKIGGIGNIYANEGLFVAGIDPKRPAKTLTEEEQEKLYKAILQVLKKGLKYRGASELNFVDALGQDGQYQKHFLVYAQDGEPCPNKNGIIRKIKLAGRGTYFCPACQS